jgi:tetratricopeptide (TPR) repeat protein
MCLSVIHISFRSHNGWFFGQALAHSQLALRLAQGAEAKATQAEALNMVGWNLAMTGSYQQALGFCQQALALHHQLGDTHSEPSTLDSLAHAHRHLGHHAQAYRSSTMPGPRPWPSSTTCATRTPSRSAPSSGS